MGKILLFGGTFNPIHKGHTRAVEIMDNELDFDKIIIMPSKIPPHKIAKNLASEQHRLEMCRLAFSENEKAEISDFEITRNNVSYSYYTVKYLKECYPEDDICMAVGSDMLLTFDKWYKFDSILKMCSLVCVSREDGDENELLEKAEYLSKWGKAYVLKAEAFEISSTQIREMLQNNEDTSCYLDESVVKYIRENNVYVGDDCAL
ncbi:MAG: nicotinate (nicotinamide) nucleotide adenylyltransferase [Ruminococcus sp.]|nr:nicotinate (nicotinamide) nucleotide adenylyltransferase [Ruminococcus sp.]